MSSSREIRLIDESDGGWSAIDVDTNVASQGETREDALSNLDEALALYREEIGHEPTDEELEALGIGPEVNARHREEAVELPDVLQSSPGIWGGHPLTRCRFPRCQASQTPSPVLHRGLASLVAQLANPTVITQYTNYDLYVEGCW